MVKNDRTATRTDLRGDGDPNSPDLHTLNGLFPKRNYFGDMALLGPPDVIDVHSTVI